MTFVIAVLYAEVPIHEAGVCGKLYMLSDTRTNLAFQFFVTFDIIAVSCVSEFVIHCEPL